VSFKDEGWARRFDAMGDEAEGMFEGVCTKLGQGFTRYGLNRPPLRMSMLPARLRYTPDYLMSAKLVEVQGCGKDGLVKLKLDKQGALHWWNDVHPVELFLWHTQSRNWCFVPLTAFDSLIESGQADLQQFPEGKAYFAYPFGSLYAQADLKGVCDAEEA
jgi:hypothetical protein